MTVFLDRELEWITAHYSAKLEQVKGIMHDDRMFNDESGWRKHYDTQMLIKRNCEEQMFFERGENGCV